ncbi:hypothetical protein KFL_010490030 [Klebsormidium nitens]|uniref:Uncharacterized protein n=1 Tax=Klebsormidium nitens TaxID=105231 RepID=A0A1Y1IUM9_KLENI|nr:hypothetical protein KFL_010490030 [Klebsormidium nitens]|eukprot:GAQ92556.1 hypothetical protein KFL_010490030 [Klebsormidium nitens]
MEIVEPEDVMQLMEHEAAQCYVFAHLLLLLRIGSTEPHAPHVITAATAPSAHVLQYSINEARQRLTHTYPSSCSQPWAGARRWQ